MYFHVETTKGKRLNHYSYQRDFMPKKKDHKTISKGEKCLVFCNGTIGRGRIAYNYKKDDAIKLLNKLIDELTSSKTDSEILTEDIKKACTESIDYGFTVDDIPF